MRQLLLLIFICGSLYNCASDGNQSESPDGSAEKYYKAGQDAMKAGNYHEATENFELLETRFPFGRYAEPTAFNKVQAYYKNSAYDSAIFAADRFIKLYPRNAKLDHAYYWKGVSQMELQKNLFQRFFKQDYSERDLGEARSSFDTFSQLIQLFPTSIHIDNATMHLVYIRNVLAKREMHIAQYYLKRGAYLAAVQRADYVVQHFQGTSSVTEALELMYQGYTKMGLTDQAEQTLAILKLNTTDS